MVFLLIEVLIAKYTTGFVRGYIGDVLVIPTVYYLARMTFFPKDGIFSVYVLPFICYSLGWIAEILQAIHITDILGIEKGSALAIAFGGVCDLRDGVSYLFGLYLIGVLLMLENRFENRLEKREVSWYPLAVFLHWTWGYFQTMVGFFVYLWYIRCPHYYYRGVVRTAWPMNTGLSLGMFIFTAWEPSKDDVGEKAKEQRTYCEELAVHEYGHVIQALLLGPLYLLIIALPSVCWMRIPGFQNLRMKKQIPYTWLYCEKWASKWGEKVTKQKALWN